VLDLVIEGGIDRVTTGGGGGMNLRPPMLCWQDSPQGFPVELLMYRQFLAVPWVDLWFLNVDRLVEREGITPYQPWLSPEERHRSDRFKVELLRRRFIVIRGILRALIGWYQGKDPREVQFTYGDRGKPELVVGAGQEPLRFNLSHGQHYALYGFSPNPLGVDLEVTGKPRDREGIAQRFFAPEEQAVLRQVAAPVQDMAFLRHWVCKEAVVKATGEGLSGNLQKTPIVFTPDLRVSHPEPVGGVSITLYEVTPSLKTIAAVAVQG
jgi:4'-phosphopantetheinyl transferase